MRGVPVKKCKVLLISYVFLTFVLGILRGEGPKETILSPQEDVSRLCGVNSLYIALRFIGDERPNFDALLRHFPNARKDGTSFRELTRYFDAYGIPWRYAKIGREQLREINNGVVFFVLTQYEGGAHLHIMRKKDSGTVQIIDAPDVFLERNIEKMDGTVLDCLLVARTAGDLPKNLTQPGRIKFWLVTAGAFLVGMVLVLYSVRRKRDSQ
jgi:hypothetical protein